MSLPPYPKYKDSGVEWLGKVPEHWAVRKFRYCFRESAEKIETSVVGEMLSVSGYRGIEVKEYDDENRRRVEEDLVGYRIVREGQLVVNTMWLNYAGLGVSDFEGHVSPAYRSYWILDGLDKRFVHHLMRSGLYVIGYTRLLTGIRPNSLQMSRDDLMEFPIIAPQEEEQAEIAGFLDTETAKIDTLVEKQRRLIELLKEKRQAIISHAVTKGLNLDAPMKDSGIEWFGEMPSHWDVVRLKFIAHVQGGVAKGRDLESRETIEVPYLRVANVQDGYLDLEEVAMIEIAATELERYALQPGDVLMNEGGDFDKLGRGHIWRGEIPGCIHQNHVFAVRLERLEPEWLNLVTSAECGRFYFMSRSKQSTNLASISSSNIQELPVPCPPTDERLLIIEHVRVETLELDSLLAEATHAIDLLQERRTALISAAVTGKIDVRSHIAKLVLSTTQYSSGFAHQLLAAEILDRCNSPRMGRIKLQKLIHLCEYHGQIDEVHGDYSRKAAGPFDAKAMAGIRLGLEKQRWFQEIKEGERYLYQPLEKCGEHKKYLAHWQTQMARIVDVLNLLGSAKTRQCEIVSTLYAAWNDLLIDKLVADDNAILHEASSAERWHKSKEKIEPEVWRKALQWMKDKELIPVGYGKHTRHTAGSPNCKPEDAS